MKNAFGKEVIDSFDGDYRFLSNFYPAEVELDGLKYPTVEHAYQAAKTFNKEHRKIIAGLATPGAAKRIGNDMLKLRPDWEFVKLGIMEDLLRQKFQNPDLRIKLIETEGRDLIEGNDWGDRFWGVCQGVGQNHLGRLLMMIRNEILSHLDTKYL